MTQQEASKNMRDRLEKLKQDIKVVINNQSITEWQWELIGVHLLIAFRSGMDFQFDVLESQLKDKIEENLP